MGRRRKAEYISDDGRKTIRVIDPETVSMECEWCGKHVEVRPHEVKRRHGKDAATRHFKNGCKKKRRTDVQELEGRKLVAAAPALPPLTFRKDAAWVVQCHDFVPMTLLESAADRLGRMKSRWEELDRSNPIPNPNHHHHRQLPPSPPPSPSSYPPYYTNSIYSLVQVPSPPSLPNSSIVDLHVTLV